jgi:hypothetical protein
MVNMNSLLYIEENILSIRMDNSHNSSRYSIGNFPFQ